MRSSQCANAFVSKWNPRQSRWDHINWKWSPLTVLLFSTLKTPLPLLIYGNNELLTQVWRGAGRNTSHLNWEPLAFTRTWDKSISTLLLVLKQIVGVIASICSVPNSMKVKFDNTYIPKYIFLTHKLSLSRDFYVVAKVLGWTLSILKVDTKF